MDNISRRDKRFKKGFTLIEVMIAVMIISIVIAALLKIKADNVNLFSTLKYQVETNQYLSLLMQSNYGFEDKDITLDKLVNDFDVEHDLRTELKRTKVKLIYQEMQKIDTGSFEDDTQDNENSNSAIFEIGRSIIKTDKSSSSLLRLRIK